MPIQQGGAPLGEKRPVTSSDVARLAMVSQSTVSRAFNEATKLSPETRSRVLEAARQLGYRPNAIARSLVSSRTDMIGLIVMRNGSPFYNELVNLLVTACRRYGYCAMVIRQLEGESGVDTVTRALEYRVDGVVVTAIEDTKSACELCRQASVPIVLLNRYIAGADVDSVCCDNERAGEMIVEFLAGKGHHSVACLMGDASASTTRDRLQGMVRRAEALQMSVAGVRYGDYTYESGFEMACSLLEDGAALPGAIFCSGDIITFGAMDALRQKFGLRIPEDVSVIGFDDTTEAAWKAYDLTTVRQPYEDLVETTCRLLMRRMEDPRASIVRALHPCVLVERSSVGERNG